jgi:gliding motility-associated-like protein
MKYILVLFFFVVTHSSLHAQPLWSCDGSLIITVNGDFYINRVSAGEIDVNLELLPLPNFGLINGIGYRRSNNYIYGVDANIPGISRIFKLSPLGEYQITQTLSFKLGTTGTMSFDDNHLIIPYHTDSTENLLYVDITENGIPNNYTISIDRGSGPESLAGTDVALDFFTNELHSYDPFTQEFVIASASTLMLTSRKQLPVQLDSFFRSGIAFLDNQVLAGIAGNRIIGFHHLNSNTIIDEIESNLNFTGDGFTDACSCVNFDIALQQSFARDTLFQCKEANSTIRVVNRSSSPLPGENFILRDSFPPGIIIKNILHNPYQGSVTGLGTNILEINNFEPIFGIDSIVLRLEITEGSALGAHEIQAVLNGFTDLEIYPNGRLLSDDPSTYSSEEVPTPFFIVKSDSLATINTQYYICEEETLFLNPIEDEPGYAVVWEDGSTTIPRLISQPGTYSLTISDACIDREFSLSVEDVYLAADLGADQTSLFGNDVEVIADIDSDLSIVSYSWYLNDSLFLYCTEPCDLISLSPEESASLFLIIEDENGCMASDDLNIRLEYPLFAPNIFSPNNDGINDIFYLQSSGKLAFQNFRIFDRWGGLVFEQKQGYTNDVNLGWSGSSSTAKAHHGTYVWEVTILLGSGSKTTHLSGDVVLLR